MMLFDEDSVLDLVCRGFTREEVIERCGVDPGYHGSRVRSELLGVDRVAYKVAYVCEHHGHDELAETLEQYASSKMSKTELLLSLGISGGSSERLIKVATLFERLGMSNEFADADRRRRRGDMARGMVELYGVDNPFKLDKFQQRAADTREQRYGGRYTLSQNSCLAEAAHDTLRAHFHDDAFREMVNDKRRQTCLARLHVDHPMHSQAVLAKVQATKRAHGVYTKSNKMTKAVRKRLSQGRQKAEALRIAGEKPPRKRRVYIEEERRQQSERMRQWRASLDDATVRSMVEKARQTSLQRYGQSHYSKTDEFRNRLSAYMRAPENSIRIRQCREATCLERYGFSCVTQRPEQRRRQSQRMSDPAYQQHIHDVACEHGCEGHSLLEQYLKARLIEVFGPDDVMVEHYDMERYPHRCDFYIPSRDLFIEANGTWTHGPCWYDAADADCVALATLWESRLSTSPYYHNALVNWTQTDVKKRACAREHQLNYVVFWDGWNNSWTDVELWFALGCPDGRDWDHEYSWIPECDHTLMPQFALTEQPKASLRASQAAAMWANWRVFYARELALWERNTVLKRGRARGTLYANRWQYLHKLPSELTDAELLRGLGIMGAVHAYSHFDARAMFEMLQKRQVRSVYDPCAGWGERLTFAAASHMRYMGVDVNAAVVEGQQRLIDHWQLTDCDVVYADAAMFDASTYEHEAVIVCPPYGSFEHYTDDGAENLDDQAFRCWWDAVVQHCLSAQTRWFVLQTNQRYRTLFSQGIEAAGFHIEEVVELSVSSSHKTRNQDGRSTKHEHESVIVFARDMGKE